MFGEEVCLILANVLRAQAIGRVVEISSERSDVANVVACGPPQSNDDNGVPPA